jgi:peptide/nickel transport system substrate-binding protein
MLTNEKLWTGDWTKGKAGGYGTGECDWFLGGTIARLAYSIGQLAERFEISPTKDKMTFYLRKGVRWHNKPPTNGRELNADDVVASLQRHLERPFGAIYRYNPKMTADLELSKVDDYTVAITFNPLYLGDFWLVVGYAGSIFPKDAIEAFGDFTDWRNSIGTGPFMLKEYVAGSYAHLVRNPNYWEKDPIGVGEGNQLPYLDAVRLSIIPDESTRLAAFRTGQIDILTMGWEPAQEFLRDPRLKHVRYLDDYAPICIYMRTDKRESPFADKRVRQALMLGLDQQRILKELLGGEGTLYTWPLMPTREYEGATLPPDKLPQSVRRLYEYHPEEAKKLLAEAGYPNGFKTSIICYNTPAYIDILSMVKADWAKIGVELEIQPKDSPSFMAIHAMRNYPEMLLGWYAGGGDYIRASNYTGTPMWNSSYVDDPMLNKARDEMLAAFPDEAKVDAIHRDLMPYLLEQAYVLVLPRGYTYRFWWPWVKNYSGEGSVGYWNGPSWTKYVWIDQNLKQSVLGK